MENVTYVNIENHEVAIKNLAKVYSDKGRVLKGEVIEYYVKIAPLILPHIHNKPFSMIHFPDGESGKSFYQKQCPREAPAWLKTVSLKSSVKGSIDWCLVNDTASMVYMANRGVIEMHTWFSRLPDLTAPDMAVIDLDPSGDTGFKEAVYIARVFRSVLEQLNVYSVPKTSGGRGLHICIPVKNADFNRVQEFLKHICISVAATYPQRATMERSVIKRGDKIYLDAVQNAQGKTITAPYSLRARPHIPVSTPLEWDELLSDTLMPADFTIRNIFARISEKGDLLKDFYKKAQELPKF